MPVCLSVNESSLQTVYFTYAVIAVDEAQLLVTTIPNRSYCNPPSVVNYGSTIILSWVGFYSDVYSLVDFRPPVMRYSMRLSLVLSHSRERLGTRLYATMVIYCKAGHTSLYSMLYSHNPSDSLGR